MRRQSLFFGVLVGLATGLVLTSAASAQQRIALVIGNAAYRNAEPLPNPTHDAQAIGEILTRIGFEAEVKLDLDQRGMQEAFRDFGLKAEGAEVALVYYAGHGIQVDSDNYLLPVDTKLERERDLIYESVPLSVVLGEVAQAQRLGMVILDACRDNPLAENLRRSLGPIRSNLIGQGLARVEDIPSNTLIAFSTRFDQIAIDGHGELSPFTEALIKHMQEPGLELNLMFRKVRDSVLEATAYRQEPRTLDALGAEPFYFIAQAANQSPTVADMPAVDILDNAGATPLAIPAPSDPDNDPLTIQVMGLPKTGAVKAGDRGLQFGDQLTAEQLGLLSYEPVAGAVGDVGAFLFVVRDGRGGITTGRVPIVVTAGNQAPQVQALGVLQLPPIPLRISKPVDPDGDELAIHVVAVPSRGAVKNGEAVVQAGDVLTPDELTALVLDASTGAEGAFEYEVRDNRGSSTTARLELGLPALNAVADAPAPAPVATPAAPPAEPEIKVAERTFAPQSEPEPVAPAEEPVPVIAEVAEPAPGDAALFETVTTSNLRRDADANSTLLTTLPAGARVKVITKAEGRNWYWIETEAGEQGYISGKLIQPVKLLAALPSQPEQPAEPAAPATPPATQTAALTAARAALSVFRDCPTCPEMVALPAGQFTMGSNAGDASERPAREVDIGRSFAIGKYEVTEAEWAACAQAGACRALESAEPGSAVRNISWPEASAYVEWLSSTTGQRYRLPSEAEWEYAARAGTTTRYWWGDEAGQGNANCADCGGAYDRKKPADIGTFPPNAYGLHDMNGGVSEWVADCWTHDHAEAPRDGSVRTAPNCRQYVLRGGSWRNGAQEIGAPSRLGYDAAVRYYTNGLRVARDLD